MNKEYKKPEIITEETRDAKVLAGCAQRYTMGCRGWGEFW